VDVVFVDLFDDVAVEVGTDQADSVAVVSERHRECAAHDSGSRARRFLPWQTVLSLV
jgi:hypothetical protein